MEKETEVKKQEGLVVISESPLTIIKQALAGGLDLDKARQLLELQKDWEANEALKAYNKAMAEFKANPPRIDKDRKVGYSTSKGTVGYSHASLANVTEKISEGLSKYGLSASWRTHQGDKIVVTCRITHALGHSEETSLGADPDISGSKNQIQAIGSTVTYLERYTLLSMTGLATRDQDDDGKASAVEYITDEQLHTIRDGLISVEANEGKFIKYLDVEKLEMLPKSDYQKAISAIQASQKKREEKDNENN